ncbi:alpha/beta fold hydrolase [Acuticoccus kandeliae]|uniref:alpha/beta fold hydrolase n=1 Tax=Acuticoccus kandeliae TaxID=2073160 RepID=UPI000D3E1F8E|nr:alpha/beta fold hydrolase [Acuticoccus kandeliae]
MAVTNGTLNGISYSLEGVEGAPVVTLSNSLCTDRRMWDGQMDYLAARYQVLRYDVRGHGQSVVSEPPYTYEGLTDDIAAILDHLGIKETHFAGVSMGGMAAQMLAIRRPDLVKSICPIATAPNAPYGSKEVWTNRIAVARSEGGLANLVAPTMDRWITLRTRRNSPAAFKALSDMVLATPPLGYEGCCLAIVGFDVRADLGKIDCPTLIIAGEEDPGTTVDDARVIHEGIRGSRLEIIEHGKHILNVDQKAAFEALFYPWLAEQTGIA